MRTFLAVHAREIVAVDFFLVPTLTCRLLFVHVSVTDQPTAVWTARQILEAFPNETAPRYLLRDRDAIYGECFTRCIANMGVERWSSLSGHPGRTRSTNGSSAQSVASA
jgi:putative transposase